MAARWQISQDVRTADAIPYFNWDAPITNALRRALQSGSIEDRLDWNARIMREAQYYDVWAFVSLRRDVLPLWEQLRPRPGRRRAFWEFLVDRWRRDGRGDERTLVDLVVDRAPQAIPEKPRIGDVRIDPLEEIAANKLCALLDRNEPRDLFDLSQILASGVTLETALSLAITKHAGADPATLAFAVVSNVVPDTAAIPAETTRDDLERFKGQLIADLTAAALPSADD